MSFVNTLSTQDRDMLRKIVKKVHFQYFDEKHTASFVTNEMLDQRIDAIAPEIVERMIKFGVDKGLR
jgi:hypothetical protein